MAPTRALLVADDPLARGGIAALLAPERLVAVVGEGTLDDAPALVEAHDPDALCWDPGADGGAAPRLVAAAGERPIVALLGGGASGAELVRAGVRGVLERSTDGAVLAAALHAAALGLSVLDPARAAGWLRPPAAPEDGPDALTPREREVLALLAEGLGNKAIAARLGISDHTAKFHVNAILAKLGAESRAEAIVLAARRGMVML